uniref:Uncharacterized protein n=1 Tax=Avena sativa TaxID=4498 RepID=A0ACD5XK43_AVESA
MSSQSATMAESAGAAPAHLHRGIPDEISIWEILVRLPPKALLRCRAVCPAWRRATSTRDFLLAHHARQPTLPLLIAGEDDGSVDIIAFDHWAGIAAPDQLQSVARLGCRDNYLHPEASCDGLLIHFDRNRQFSICNPATHQYAPLPQLYGFHLLGMYRHSPTGEYRLLLRKLRDFAPSDQDGSYVFTLGSGQPPTHLGYLEPEEVIYFPLSILFRGNLHWHINQQIGNNRIMVFDTAAELFWQMHAPAVPAYAHLFEMDDMLGLASFNYARTVIDIWMMQDYESQVWAFKCRIELPVQEVWVQSENYRVVMPGDGGLLVLVNFGDRLYHFDIHGELVASFHHSGIGLTQLRLKQTLVPHTLFPTLEGDVVNDSPFI